MNARIAMLKTVQSKKEDAAANDQRLHGKKSKRSKRSTNLKKKVTLCFEEYRINDKKLYRAKKTFTSLKKYLK